MKRDFIQAGKLLGMLLLTLCMGLASCSKDDDGDDNSGFKDQGTISDANTGIGNFDAKLSAPAYEGVSAFYNITSANSDIKSLELTESGSYIIVKNGLSKSTKIGGLLRRGKSLSKYGTLDNIIEGKFTKKSDTEFELEGYGTLKITGSADNAISLVIVSNDGSETTLSAERKNQLPDSDATALVCRTWSLSTMRLIYSLDGKVVFDKEYKMNELNKVANDFVVFYKDYLKSVGLSEYADLLAESMAEEEEFDSEDNRFAEKIIFTKAGSYMVTYNDNTTALATWSWKNVTKGLMRYSWNYNDMGDVFSAGTVSVGTRGSQLAISENFFDAEDADVEDDMEDMPSEVEGIGAEQLAAIQNLENMSLICIYYMDEVK